MTAVMTLSGETPAGRGLESDVALAAAGDQFAFERLYRTHVARIHSLTRRMLSTQEADEVTQDIFVRTWQKLGQFRGEAAFSTKPRQSRRMRLSWKSSGFRLPVATGGEKTFSCHVSHFGLHWLKLPFSA